MKRVPVILFCLAVLGPMTWAQENDTTVERHEIIVLEVPQDYFTIRFGVWYPKDMEKTWAGAEDLKTDVKQSQAVGLDFHYRKNIGRPLFFDMSVSGWYSTYDFELLDQTSNLEIVRDASSWAAIIPVTIGLSATPFPENPIQPYAMVGIGGYIAVHGVNRTPYDMRESNEETDVAFAFGGYFGAGLDFLFTPGFGASLGLKYHLLQYKKRLFTQQKNFNGLQVQLGIAIGLR